MHKRLLNLAILACLASFVFACAASVPTAAPAADAAVKSASVTGDKGRVFIVRKGQFFGKAILFSVSVDGKSIGALAPDTYRFVDLAPGRHRIRVQTDENSQARTIDVVAGREYYVVAYATGGEDTAQVELEPERVDGRPFVQKAKLAQ